MFSNFGNLANLHNSGIPCFRKYKSERRDHDYVPQLFVFLHCHRAHTLLDISVDWIEFRMLLFRPVTGANSVLPP